MDISVFKNEVTKNDVARFWIENPHGEEPTAWIDCVSIHSDGPRSILKKASDKIRSEILKRGATKLKAKELEDQETAKYEALAATAVNWGGFKEGAVDVPFSKDLFMEMLRKEQNDQYLFDPYNSFVGDLGNFTSSESNGQPSPSVTAQPLSAVLAA